MKRKTSVFLAALGLLLPAFLCFGQFTPEEISKRDFWEDFLLTAEIVKWEKIGEGVTDPVKLYLKRGDVEAKGVWKNPSGIQKGFLEGWKYEVAAYRLDKLLGLNMVPPTVEKSFKGAPGSLQLWVTSKYSLLKMVEEGISFPASASDRVNKMKYVARAWDSLIANDDRTQQNILYTEDWRTILIDHSRSFRSSREHSENLVYGKRGLKSTEGRTYLFRQLPRGFVERIKALDLEKVKAAVGSTLTDKEIEALLARRQVLLDEIEELIKESGEQNVLY